MTGSFSIVGLVTGEGLTSGGGLISDAGLTNGLGLIVGGGDGGGGGDGDGVSDADGDGVLWIIFSGFFVGVAKILLKNLKNNRKA